MGTFIQDGAAVIPPTKRNENTPTGEDTEYAAGDVNQVREALLDLRTQVLIDGGNITALDGAISGIQTNYQLRSEKGAPSGYAGLDASAQIPAGILPDLSGTYQPVSQKGAANGYASLGADGLVPATQLPDTAAGVYIPLAQKGAVSGVAPLEADGLISTLYLPPEPSQPYDVVLFYPGKPANSALMLRMTFVRSVTFPIHATNSRATAGVAATASTTLTLLKNGVSFGTIVFDIGGTTGTWTVDGADVVFAAGDILTITNQASADATLADISITFTGAR